MKKKKKDKVDPIDVFNNRLLQPENIMYLIGDDAEIFFDSITNPPEPNDALKEAAKNYKNFKKDNSD